MRIEILIILITSFFVYNSYNDGKYIKLFLSYKKYYQMGFFIFIGISAYYILKKNPVRGKKMLLQASNIIKYLPVDKTGSDLISPIFDLTTPNTGNITEPFSTRKEKPQGSSKSTKRSVSETKKKFVAYSQEWKCGKCNLSLDHTFEIDHKTRLEHGGSNDTSNLIALCRNCHGVKTANENM